MTVWKCRAGGLIVGALLMGWACLTAGAQTTIVTLQDGFTTVSGTSDNSIYSDNVTFTNGGGEAIIVGRTGTTSGNVLRRGLISFDLSSLPANIQIVDVTLQLHANMSYVSSFPLTVKRVTNSWGEGTVDANGPGDDSGEGAGAAAGNGDATWNSNHHNVSTWTTAGGDFDAAVSGSGSDVGGGAVVIRGSGLISDVQGWVNSTFANNGWIIIGNEVTNQSTARLVSSENLTVASRPALIIEYQMVTEVPRVQWLLTEVTH